MKNLILSLMMLLACHALAQSDTSSKWLRGFPITDYMVVMSDSVTVVQLEMPDGLVLKDKQLGLMYGVDNGRENEMVQKGFGRCHLIKGNYYYFAIHTEKTAAALKKGDLLYVFLDKSAIYYGLFPQLSGQFIRLKNAYDSSLYDRYTIFQNWTKEKEELLIDSIWKDTKYAASYYKKNSPSADQVITTGPHSGLTMFNMLENCSREQVESFLHYMVDHPRFYAGKEVMFVEIFAHWFLLGNG